MVKKLLKHEIVYYIRTLLLFWPWVLLTGIMARLVNHFYDDSTVMRIALASSTILLVLSVFALMLYSFFAGVVRFYKNLYSSEGYLTFSLPVTNLQHIFVKLLSSVAVLLVSGLVVLVTLSIAYSWEPFRVIWHTLEELFRLFPPVHLIFYLLEITGLLLVGMISVPLLFYACISVGQLAKKNRILLAIGAYYIHDVILRILGTVLVILLSVLAQAEFVQTLLRWFLENLDLGIHLLLLGSLLIVSGFAAVYFFITYYIMNRKLNLE